MDERTAFSVCTGVGGLDLGLERVGWRIVAQCEKDAYRRSVLARHWPGVPCFEDIREVSQGSVGERLRQVDRGSGGADAQRQRVPLGGADARVDLLAGGTPCQDLSVAGRRAGLVDGERSSLFFEFVRIADELVRPGGWLLFENVPGLLSSPGGSASGRDFAVVLATLADIGFHDLAWRVLDSRFFGVPQRRRRVFIVGRRAVGDRARAVLLEPESGGGDFAPGREAGPRVAASLTSGAHGAGVSPPGRRQQDDENIVGSLQGHSDGAGYRLGADEAAAGQLVAGAVIGRYGKGTDSDATDTLITHTLTSEGFDASEDGTGRGTPLVTFRASGHAGSNGLGVHEHGDSPTLDRDGSVAIAGTIRSHQRPGSNSSTDILCPPSDPDGVRATPRTPGRVDDPLPDGPRYSACGDAVTVNVAQWIGERILLAEIKSRMVEPATSSSE